MQLTKFSTSISLGAQRNKNGIFDSVAAISSFCVFDTIEKYHLENESLHLENGSQHRGQQPAVWCGFYQLCRLKGYLNYILFMLFPFIVSFWSHTCFKFLNSVVGQLKLNNKVLTVVKYVGRAQDKVSKGSLWLPDCPIWVGLGMKIPFPRI